MIAATNRVVRKKFGDGPVIALNAHGDVVSPGAGWTKDPYGAEIVDGWMYGRGVAVSKSDFATYAYALLARSEEHTSELQSLMRISYAVFCLKKKQTHKHHKYTKRIT